MVVEIVPQMDQQDQAAEQAEQTKTNQSIIENILRFFLNKSRDIYATVYLLGAGKQVNLLAVQDCQSISALSGTACQSFSCP